MPDYSSGCPQAYGFVWGLCCFFFISGLLGLHEAARPGARGKHRAESSRRLRWCVVLPGGRKGSFCWEKKSPRNLLLKEKALKGSRQGCAFLLSPLCRSAWHRHVSVAVPKAGGFRLLEHLLVT